MPLIKNPGKQVQVGHIRLVMGVVGPIVQTSSKNYLPYQYYCWYNGSERVQGWTYREGPVKRAELVTNLLRGEKTLWFGWR